MELELLLAEISKRWGYAVGLKIKQEIDAVVGANAINLDQLKNAITVIQGILDADPNTKEFDVAQNIVSTLSDHLARIVVLEGKLTTIDGKIATIQSTIDKLSADTKTSIDDAKNEAISTATSNAQTYADNTFVKKADVKAISASDLATKFAKAMDCAYSGATLDDVLAEKGACAKNGSGDGAVI